MADPVQIVRSVVRSCEFRGIPVRHQNFWVLLLSEEEIYFAEQLGCNVRMIDGVPAVGCWKRIEKVVILREHLEDYMDYCHDLLDMGKVVQVPPPDTFYTVQAVLATCDQIEWSD